MSRRLDNSILLLIYILADYLSRIKQNEEVLVYGRDYLRKRKKIDYDERGSRSSRQRRKDRLKLEHDSLINPDILRDVERDIKERNVTMNDKDVQKRFEINQRHSGTTYMRALFGYHEVIYILKYVLENKVTNFSLQNGKAMRFYDEKLV